MNRLEEDSLHLGRKTLWLCSNGSRNEQGSYVETVDCCLALLAANHGKTRTKTGLGRSRLGRLGGVHHMASFESGKIPA